MQKPCEKQAEPISGSIPNQQDYGKVAAEQRQASPLMPLFPESSFPQTVRITEAPLPLGSNPIFTEIPLSEFLVRLKRKGWTESLLIDDKCKQKPLSDREYAQLQDILFCDPTAFGFVNMKPYGWSAVALKPIPKGAKILYGGVIKKHKDYSTKKQTHCIGSVKSIREDDPNADLVDAVEYGNIASVFQHAPCNSTLELYRFSREDVKKTIQMANWTGALHQLGNRKILIFVSTREIRPFEPLTVDYGLEYWKMLEESPVLFDAQLNVIPLEYYSYEFPELIFRSPILDKDGRVGCSLFSKTEIVSALREQTRLHFSCPPFVIEPSAEELGAKLATFSPNSLAFTFDNPKIFIDQEVYKDIFKIFMPEFENFDEPSIKELSTLGIKNWALRHTYPPSIVIVFESTLMDENIQQRFLEPLHESGLENYGLGKFASSGNKKSPPNALLVFKNIMELPKKLAEFKNKRQFSFLTEAINNLFGEQFIKSLATCRGKAWSFTEDNPKKLELVGKNMPTLATVEWFQIKLAKLSLGLEKFVESKKINTPNGEKYRLVLKDLPELEKALIAIAKPKVKGAGVTAK